MIKRFAFLWFFIFSIAGFSQIRPVLKTKKGKTLELGNGNISNRLGDSRLDSLVNRDEFKVELSRKTTFKDYKILSFKRDSVFVDTTLTINKYYRFNFIRKDNFELLPFHNQGQTFNKLAYDFDNVGLYPAIGATTKHYNYLQVEDINYYQVATPFTELMYRKGLEQGQVLDALITLNFSESQNMSLSYKGLRSLGKYRKSLSSHGNMRFTYTFTGKNKKYHLLSHITAQELYNDENGGLIPSAVTSFVINDKDFKERGRLETEFTDANNMLRGNRYYVNHDYLLLKKSDSLLTKYILKVGHVFNYETKHYQFTQATKNKYFGDAFTSKITDKSHLTTLYNQVNAQLKSPLILGELKVFLENYHYNFQFNNVVILNNSIIPQGLKSDDYAVGAKWKTAYKGIALQAEAATTMKGDLNGNYFKATGSYTRDSLFVLKATFLNNSKAPNFNYVLNQSAYLDYNWNNSQFKNEITRTFIVDLKSDKLLNVSAQITQLDNYTYLSDTLNSGYTKPVQYERTVNYLKLKVSKAISYGKFTIDNTIMYQKVANGSEVFRVPEFVTRNSIYYSNSIFKGKPMFLQTGITFKYFTKYFANAYNPLLSEFNLQNTVEIGNYPVFDVFINAKVRSMRLYLNAEHINTLFDKNRNYFSAPNYPYRDFVLRFGIVWNFFI